MRNSAIEPDRVAEPINNPSRRCFAPTVLPDGTTPLPLPRGVVYHAALRGCLPPLRKGRERSVLSFVQGENLPAPVLPSPCEGEGSGVRSLLAGEHSFARHRLSLFLLLAFVGLCGLSK